MKHPVKQNSRIYALLLAFLLIPVILPAHAESTDSLHLYLGIPFDTSTVEMVTDILAKEKNAIFEMNPNGVLTGYACNIEEYGYLFDLSIDFSDGQPQRAYSFVTGEEFTRYPPAIERILLHSLQNTRITPEEGKQRIPADIQQYLDMMQQMTRQYGQPDVQFFKTSRMNGNKTIRYQFEDGQWTADRLQQVVDQDQRLVAYTVWGNITLQLEVDLAWRYEGVYLSLIDLIYEPVNHAEGFDQQNAIEIYPTIVSK